MLLTTLWQQRLAVCDGQHDERATVKSGKMRGFTAISEFP
jgi:hypothetical protein